VLDTNDSEYRFGRFVVANRNMGELESCSLVILPSYPQLLILHSIHPRFPLSHCKLLGGMSIFPSTNLPPFSISFVNKAMILYLNTSVIFYSINEHTLSLRKIITSSQLTFPKISQMRKIIPSMMQSMSFPHGLMLKITIIITLSQHIFQYSTVKPDTVEEGMQNWQLRTRQMALRLSYF